MKTFKDPFIDYLPKVDLHGYDKVLAKIVVEEFINDNIKLRNEKIIIIHGLGQNIIKTYIHEYLRKNKKVKSFKLNWNNPGITEVILNIKD